MSNWEWLLFKKGIKFGSITVNMVVKIRDNCEGKWKHISGFLDLVAWLGIYFHLSDFKVNFMDNGHIMVKFESILVCRLIAQLGLRYTCIFYHSRGWAIFDRELCSRSHNHESCSADFSPRLALKSCSQSWNIYVLVYFWVSRVLNICFDFRAIYFCVKVSFTIEMC